MVVYVQMNFKFVGNLYLMDRQVSAIPFSLFRFFFGILMIPQIYGLSPFIHELSNSIFVFHYPYLSFIEAYSHELITFLTWSAVFSALFLALGILSNVSSFIFLLAFGYLFLIDRTFYNNHYYLWCLLSFLFVLTPRSYHISIFDVFKGRFRKKISLNAYWPFVILFSIVYFYGGIVKINPDWLNGQPMRLMMQSRDLPMADFLGYFVSYSGLLFDLFIWIFLLWRPKSWYVFLPYFTFHISNYFIFNIGEFPLVMIAAWLLFLPFEGIHMKQYFVEWLKSTSMGVNGKILLLFLTFQMVWPLRPYLIGGNIAWHRQGYYFSWRMMLNNHQMVDFQYRVEIPEKNISYWVDFGKMLTPRQFSNTYHDPYHIWMLARKLKDDAQKKYNSKAIKVYCRSLISLNAREPQLLINDTINIADQQYFLFKHNDFINRPLKSKE